MSVLCSHTTFRIRPTWWAWLRALWSGEVVLTVHEHVRRGRVEVISADIEGAPADPPCVTTVLQ